MKAAVGHHLVNRYEYCVSVEDFLARRTRLSFLDKNAAEAAIPKVRCCWLCDRAGCHLIVLLLVQRV